MAKVFVKHKVKDYAKWKKTFDDFVAQRRAGGERSYSIGHVPNEPNVLCLTFDWDSIENANAFFGSEELRETMQEATVTDVPEIFTFEITEEGQT